MINRWQGNSGKRQQLPEASDRYRGRAEARPPPPREPGKKPLPQHESKTGSLFSGLESITKLLPGKAEELETEDIILLLILYLMYRESGDSELLIIMGAMFLL